MSGVALVDWDKASQTSTGRPIEHVLLLGLAKAFDVNPAKSRLHLQVVLVGALRGMPHILHVANVFYDVGVIAPDLLMDRSQSFAVATYQIRLDLKTIDDPLARALLDDLFQLLRGLIQMRPRIRSVRMVVGKPTQQLRVECLSQIDRSLDIILKILVNGHISVLCAVIDIVQFHGLPGESDDTDAAFEALLEAKERGWTRFIGVSQDGPDGAEAATRYPLDTQEFTYNILYQEPDTVMFPTLRERGIGAIIKRPISNAVYHMPDRPQGAFMSGPWDRAQQFPLAELAGNIPLVDFTLQFTLSHPDVSTAIIGTTNTDHLRANVFTADRLDDASVSAVRAAWQEIFG